MKAFFTAVLALGLLGTAAHGQTPKPSEFVSKAGASDTFEIASAKLMATSKNAMISSFAAKMITDHTKSTQMVTSAAKADGLTPKTPMLTTAQQTDLAALKNAPAGSPRDDLYVKQQKAAHAEALALMQDYSANGSAPHLKTAAAKIVPVVQMHASMLSGQ